MEAITERRAVIPASPAEAARAKRIDQYHYMLWKMRREIRHDGRKRIH